MSALLLGLVLAWPVAQTTTAGSDRRVVIAPLTVDGSLAAPLRQTLDERLRDGLDAGVFEVVDSGTARTVRTEIVARDRDLDFSLSLVDRDGTTVVARVEEHCDMCGTVEAGDAIASLGMALSRRAELAMQATTTAPPPPPVAPPVDAAPKVEAHRRPVRWAIGWAALAGGLAASTTGVALLAIHGKPIDRKCTGGNVDADGTCRFMHSTLVPGAVVTTLGVGLLSTGIALLVIESKRAPRAPRLRALLEHTPAWQRARLLVQR